MKRLISVFGVLVAGLMVMGCDSTTGRCESLCATFEDCEDAIDEDDCIDECVSAFDSEPTETCEVAFELLGDCIEEQGTDCDDVSDDCEDEVEDFAAVCDEELEDMLGTSTTDPCTSASYNSCLYAFDGICDEGLDCAYDTDYYDCYCF